VIFHFSKGLFLIHAIPWPIPSHDMICVNLHHVMTSTSLQQDYLSRLSQQ